MYWSCIANKVEKRKTSDKKDEKARDEKTKKGSQRRQSIPL
jgi:hypothetical protein